MSRLIFFENKTSKDKKISIEKVALRIENKLNEENLKIVSKIILKDKLFIEASLNDEDKNGYKSKDYLILIDGNIHYKEDIAKQVGFKFSNTEEFVQKLYEKTSINFTDYLIGSFSLIFHDIENDKTFFLKDHLGTKPMFYSINSTAFCVSSEIKFIHATKSFSTEINERKIMQYLCQYKENNHDTFFKKIKCILPSHIMQNQKNKIIQVKYSYKFFENIEFTGRDNASKDLFRLLKSASKERYSEKYNSACLVSGGLDSSCINILLQDISKNKSKTVSMNFYKNDKNKLACDEEEFQKLIINKDSHINVNFTNVSPYGLVDEWLDRYDQPFNLANAYLWEETYKTSKANGIKVLFDGVDGDIVISHGWERFKKLFHPLYIHIFFYELFLFSKKHSSHEQKSKSLALRIIRPLLRNNFFFRPFFKAKDYFFKYSKKRKTIIKGNLLNDSNFLDTYDEMRLFRDHKENITNPMIETALSNLNILFYKFDIEQNSPFFDIKVMNYCVNLPSNLKLKDGSSRYILRQTFKNLLPKKIIDRHSKANLTHNFMNSINKEDFKKIKNEIRNIHPLLAKIVNVKELNKFYKILKEGTMKESVSMGIWSFYLTNKWLKKIQK